MDLGAKFRVPMSEYLPQDVMYQILVRVPVKSVGRFRCVSKEWRSLLSGPQFAKSHLQSGHLQGPEEVLARSSPPCVVTFTSKTHGVSREVECTDGRKTCVEGSCRGLVLLVRYMGGGIGSLVLMNTTTLEAREIPCSNVLRLKSYGLGYDSSEDDYKIVSLHCGVVCVFSVKKQNWRSLDLEFPAYAYNDGCPGTLLRGRLHWLRRGGSRLHWLPRGGGYTLVIAAFDLATEELGEVPCPRVFEDGVPLAWGLAVLGGCLAVVPMYGCSSFDVWVMKDYGVQDSWTKFTINTPGGNFMTRLCSLGEDEIVLLDVGSYTFATTYNCTTGAFKDMAVSGIPKNDILSSGRGLSFRESLVSPFYQ